MPLKSSPSPAVRPDKSFRSPHTDGAPVPVEFLILHYTACSLQGALDIFLSKKRAVSCHLLIDRGGRIFEPIPCWDGVCLKAFHAGRSRLNFSEKRVDFNNFSIGVELVNWNGNFYPYTERQYQSLFKALLHLQKLYPLLKDPRRILGHEHIAGFRGKADPGALFDWKRFFGEVCSCNDFGAEGGGNKAGATAAEAEGVTAAKRKQAGADPTEDAGAANREQKAVERQSKKNYEKKASGGNLTKHSGTGLRKTALTAERNPPAGRLPPDRRPRLSGKQIQELAPVFKEKPFLTDSEAAQSNLIIESRLSLAEQKRRLKRLLLHKTD